eukprot:1158491-Pelagomonas_calceolata.AAC.10
MKENASCDGMSDRNCFPRILHFLKLAGVPPRLPGRFWEKGTPNLETRLPPPPQLGNPNSGPYLDPNLERSHTTKFPPTHNLDPNLDPNFPSVTGALQPWCAPCNPNFHWHNNAYNLRCLPKGQWSSHISATIRSVQASIGDPHQLS